MNGVLLEKRVVLLDLETLRMVLTILGGRVAGRGNPFFSGLGALESDDDPILLFLSHNGVLLRDPFADLRSKSP
jgi:hypothetical protein